MTAISSLTATQVISTSSMKIFEMFTYEARNYRCSTLSDARKVLCECYKVFPMIKIPLKFHAFVSFETSQNRNLASITVTVHAK